MVVRPAAAARATRSTARNRPSDAVVCMCRSITWCPPLGGWRVRSSSRVAPRLGLGARLVAFRAVTLHELAILANQQLEMLALFLGKLQENALAFRVREPLAVALEEAMRAALAADAD